MCHYESATEWESLAEELREEAPDRTVETDPETEEPEEPTPAPADD